MATVESNKQHQLAEQQAKDLRRQVFCLDAQNAHRALANGDWKRAVAILREYEHDSVIRSGFVWRYLWRISHQFRTLWQEQGDNRAFCVDFTPDGTKLVAGTESGAVIVWDVAAARKLLQLHGHTSCVNALSISPTGSTLATASCDQTVRLWDMQTGFEKSVIFQDDTELYSVCFSPDETKLAVGDESGRLFLLEAHTGKIISSTRVGEWRVVDLAFDPTGKNLFAASGNALHWYDASTLQLLSTLSDHDLSVRAVEWLTQRAVVAWGGSKGLVHLFDPKRRKEISQHDVSEIWSFSFDDSQQIVACGGGDRVGVIWDCALGKVRHRLYGHKDRISGIALSPDAQTTATAGFDGSVRLWSSDNLGESFEVPGISGSNKLAYADGGELLIVSGGGQIRAIDTRDWTERYSVPGTQFAVSPDERGSWIATKSEGHITVRSSSTGEVMAEDANQWDRGRLFDLGISTDGKAIVAQRTNDLRLSRVESFAPSQFLAKDFGRYQSIVFLRGKPLVAESNTFQRYGISVHDIRDPSQSVGLGGMNGSARQIAVNVNGELVAAASEDKSVYVWNHSTQSLLMSLSGHRTQVTCLAFSPDGRLLASGDEAGLVYIWNLAAGNATLVLDAHQVVVGAVTFSPDGTTLATSTAHSDPGEGEVRLWSATPR